MSIKHRATGRGMPDAATLLLRLIRLRPVPLHFLVVAARGPPLEPAKDYPQTTLTRTGQQLSCDH